MTGPADRAPTATADDLTEHVAQWLAHRDHANRQSPAGALDSWHEDARALLSSRPLADRLAAADRDAAALARVRALAEELSTSIPFAYVAERIDHAVRGDR